MRKKLIPAVLFDDPYDEVRKFHNNSCARLVSENGFVEKPLETFFPENKFSKRYERFRSIPFETKESKLSELVANRSSIRSFPDLPIGPDVLSTIIGSLSQGKKRLYPSAGARYPCHLYAIVKNSLELPPGIYYLDFNSSSAVLMFDLPVTDGGEFGISDEHQINAPCYLVITCEIPRTSQKYGLRGYRYGLIETGIIGWQINLVLEELALESVWLGGFDDFELQNAIGIRAEIEEEYPIVVLALGRNG